MTPENPAILPLQLDLPYLAQLGLVERSELWRRHCHDLNVEAAL